jgi:pyrimidine deaminase RibD-like protein
MPCVLALCAQRPSVCICVNPWPIIFFARSAFVHLRGEHALKSESQKLIPPRRTRRNTKKGRGSLRAKHQESRLPENSAPILQGQKTSVTSVVKALSPCPQGLKTPSCVFLFFKVNKPCVLALFAKRPNPCVSV